MQDFDITGLISIEPQLPDYEEAGPEPSLEKLIYSYYLNHFPHSQAVEFTVQYVKQLGKQWNEAVQ